ncbi:crossover junction endodeoxyribonuclease RuvC [Candidatus Falkowbacteria bacterium]|nr:crossover junction endodeoxyribonuclease RuvC [Candidatus Falkowbacteria bacterium]
MTILGIDPGFARTGWGVVEYNRGKLRLVDYGCIETKKAKIFQID